MLFVIHTALQQMVMRLYTLLVDAFMVPKPCAAFQSYNNNPIHGQRSQITAKKGQSSRLHQEKWHQKCAQQLMWIYTHHGAAAAAVRESKHYAPLHCDHSKIIMYSEQATRLNLICTSHTYDVRY